MWVQEPDGAGDTRHYTGGPGSHWGAAVSCVDEGQSTADRGSREQRNGGEPGVRGERGEQEQGSQGEDKQRSKSRTISFIISTRQETGPALSSCHK